MKGDPRTTVICDLCFSVLLRDDFSRTQSGARAVYMHVRYYRSAHNKPEFKTNKY